MNTTWSTPTKYIVGVGLALLGIYVFYISLPVFPILIIAALSAFLLTPAVDFFHQRFKIPRLIAVLLSYALLILIALLSPLLLIGPMMQGFSSLAAVDYHVFLNDILSWFQITLINLRTIKLPILTTPLDLSSIINPALQFLQNTEVAIAPNSLPSMDTIVSSLQSALTVTFGVATSVVGTVSSWVLTLIITLMAAVYMTLDSAKFVTYFINLAPKPYRSEVAQLLDRLKKVWQSYIRGQTTLMITIGTTIWLGDSVLGIQGAFALGVIAGMLELLPYLGPFLAAIPAVIVALIQGSAYLDVSNFTFGLIVAVFYLTIHQVKDVFLVPRILGDAVDLHPLVVIIGVAIGATVGDILGVLLATPIIASGREIVWYLYAKILGQEPYPYPPKAELYPKPTSLWLEQSRAWWLRTLKRNK